MLYDKCCKCGKKKVKYAVVDAYGQKNLCDSCTILERMNPGDAVYQEIPWRWTLSVLGWLFFGFFFPPILLFSGFWNEKRKQQNVEIRKEREKVRK